MERKKMIISFCTITATLAVIMLIKDKHYVSNDQKLNHPKDTVLLGEGKVLILPIEIYDE